MEKITKYHKKYFYVRRKYLKEYELNIDTYLRTKWKPKSYQLYKGLVLQLFVGIERNYLHAYFYSVCDKRQMVFV